jgi:hypothetical protein
MGLEAVSEAVCSGPDGVDGTTNGEDRWGTRNAVAIPERSEQELGVCVVLEHEDQAVLAD